MNVITIDPDKYIYEKASSIATYNETLGEGMNVSRREITVKIPDLGGEVYTFPITKGNYFDPDRSYDEVYILTIDCTKGFLDYESKYWTFGRHIYARFAEAMKYVISAYCDLFEYEISNWYTVWPKLQVAVFKKRVYSYDDIQRSNLREYYRKKDFRKYIRKYGRELDMEYEMGMWDFEFEHRTVNCC